MDNGKIEVVKLTDLIPDSANANLGTERGRALLERSLEKFGAGRSVVVDRHGRIVAGNKTTEVAADIGIEDVVVVRTDGRQLVAVLREDMDLDDPETGARELAYADNRVSEVDLLFDADQIAADLADGMDLGDFWFDEELEELLAISEETSLKDSAPNVRHLGQGKKKIKPVLYAEGVKIFERAIKATGLRNRGEALVKICEYYLNDGDLVGSMLGEEGQLDF